MSLQLIIKFPLFPLLSGAEFAFQKKLPPKILFQLHHKNGAFHIGVLLRKGQERPGNRGRDDLFQAQKGIVMVLGRLRKIRRQREMRRAFREGHSEIKGSPRSRRTRRMKGANTVDRGD